MFHRSQLDFTSERRASTIPLEWRNANRGNLELAPYWKPNHTSHRSQHRVTNYKDQRPTIPSSHQVTCAMAEHALQNYKLQQINDHPSPPLTWSLHKDRAQTTNYMLQRSKTTPLRQQTTMIRLSPGWPPSSSAERRDAPPFSLRNRL